MRIIIELITFIQLCRGFGRRKTEREMKKWWAWTVGKVKPKYLLGASVGQWVCSDVTTHCYGSHLERKMAENDRVNKPITWKQASSVSEIGNSKPKKLCFVNWVNKQKVIQIMFPYVGPTEFCKIQTSILIHLIVLYVDCGMTSYFSQTM